MLYSRAMILNVIPEKRTGPEKNTFSYLVPEELKNDVKIGSIVNISFGKKNIRGVAAGISTDHPEAEQKDLDREPHDQNHTTNYKLKEIKAVNPEFVIPEKYLDIAKWISDYYLCSLGEAISLFLPPKIIRPQKSEQITGDRKPFKPIELTSEQQKIFEQLEKTLSQKNTKPALIHGVTGSGKTEIYLKLAAETLKQNKQVVVLVPEIMLTPQTVEKFERVFPDQICLFHSGLSKSEKYLSYKQFSSGHKKIIIGARSALLVPSPNIGLIIIDEEHEDAYKQEKDPRYNAVSLAEQIAKVLSALLVLGTATPRIEDYFKGKQGEYELFELRARYNKLILPPARIIDLKDEIKRDNYSPISLELQKSIADIFRRKRQIILFLNRRGMATFVSCRECGEILNCPKCNIPMVYHVSQNSHVLNCHHCDFKKPVPSLCPNCGSPKIKFFGAGVDKIESEVNRLFPKAKVRRVDAKTLENKNAYVKLYDELKNGKIDILIGTQILAKGLDIGTIDLVGIVSADVGLHLPHFRASEKTFSLLTQVSGRSGRKDNVGTTVIQTYWPDSNAIKFAAEHDYSKFYENEVSERRKFNYPPFCHLVRVISEEKNKNRAKAEIEKIAVLLNEKKLNFIGPAPCFLDRINNIYRYHLLIKVDKLPDEKILDVFKNNPYLVWDIDPIDLL